MFFSYPSDLGYNIDPILLVAVLPFKRFLFSAYVISVYMCPYPAY